MWDTGYCRSKVLVAVVTYIPVWIDINVFIVTFHRHCYCRLRLLARNRLRVAAITVKGFAPTTVAGMMRSAATIVRLHRQWMECCLSSSLSFLIHFIILAEDWCHALPGSLCFVGLLYISLLTNYALDLHYQTWKPARWRGGAGQARYLPSVFWIKQKRATIERKIINEGNVQMWMPLNICLSRETHGLRGIC
jgi:hypothetical protein